VLNPAAATSHWKAKIDLSIQIWNKKKNLYAKLFERPSHHATSRIQPHLSALSAQGTWRLKLKLFTRTWDERGSW